MRWRWNMVLRVSYLTLLTKISWVVQWNLSMDIFIKPVTLVCECVCEWGAHIFCGSVRRTVKIHVKSIDCFRDNKSVAANSLMLVCLVWMYEWMSCIYDENIQISVLTSGAAQFSDKIAFMCRLIYQNLSFRYKDIQIWILTGGATYGRNLKLVVPKTATRWH